MKKNTAFGFTHLYKPSSDPLNEKTILLLHGTGGDEESLLPVADFLMPHASVLSPRGRVLENGMPRFFKRHAEGVFDMEDLRIGTRELAGFIELSSVEYGIDPDDLIAAGYSNGANIASSVIFSYPGLLKTAVLFHPMIPFIPETPPDLSGTKVLITAGRNDPIVTVEETERLAALYRDCSAAVDLFWHNSGHSLTRGELEAAKSFLSESLLGFLTTKLME